MSGSLHWIAAEEDWPVETNDVIFTLLGVHLDCEATRVASKIWEFSAKGDSRESEEEGRLLANVGQEVCLCKVRDVAPYCDKVFLLPASMPLTIPAAAFLIDSIPKCLME